MKVAIVTDSHHGCRNDLPVFLDFQEKFYSQVFFPKIDELGIKTVLHLGDVFDRRKYINYKTLFRTKEMYFKPLADRGIWSPTVIGNHDIFHNNTLQVNALDLVANEFHFSNLKIIREPQIVNVEGFDILMVPWICDENRAQSFQMLESAPTDLCMGHFAINGFVMHQGQVAEDGLNRSVFDRYDMVFSGHFHHRSSDGRIYYLGTPYEMTWQDFNDTKGFHIFDLETRRLQFVPNPYQMFYRIVYDDEAFDYSSTEDMSRYTNVYVKVVVSKKNNQKMYEGFLQNLYSHNPFNVSIVQNYADIVEVSENFVVDQSASTIQILHKFVDEITLSGELDASQIKSDLADVYNEAINGSE